MVGELITLPLRLTGAAVRLWWRAADQAVGLASGAAGQLIERVSPPASPARRRRPRNSGAQCASDPTGTGAPSVPEPQPGTPVEGQPRLETPAQAPRHVSEEPELVEEFAEPGAENGAGPELHILEPWNGYRGMSAREITKKLAGMSAAELAVVELYETSNRKRQTILDAVARQLRSQPTGQAPQSRSANGDGSLLEGEHQSHG